uniref:Peptidase S1 domain-containing protein n=1 Tax=Nothobranchius korthausae TaxID=1143690 RepID=A0A1A8H475_9TELE
MPTSNILKETTEKMQFIPECQNIWKEHFSVLRMICTKLTKTQEGICQGDSGGPLMCNSKVQHITDFTYDNECDNPKYPHVFAKVGFYLPWMQKMMKN